MTLSEIIFPAFVTPIPIYVANELEKIQKCILWENSTSKIKHDTLCNDFKHGGFKNVDIWKKNYKSSVFIDKKIIWWLVSWMENYTPSFNQ